MVINPCHAIDDDCQAENANLNKQASRNSFDSPKITKQYKLNHGKVSRRIEKIADDYLEFTILRKDAPHLTVDTQLHKMSDTTGESPLE